MPVWLIAAAAGGVGAWFGGLTSTAVDNATSPVQSPAGPIPPNLMTVAIYSGVAFALIWGAKKALKA